MLVNRGWACLRALSPRLRRGTGGDSATNPRQSRGLRVAHECMDPVSKIFHDQRGANSIEWALLLGAIAIPSYFIIQAALNALVLHYQMITTLNALPFP